ARTRDGRLWFPTQAGLAVIDPESVPLNQVPPPVLIEGGLIDRQVFDPHRQLEIGPGQGNLEIQYTALSYIKSDQLRFKYKLEGLDRDWTEAGTRRSAYYSYLPPGTYTFRVIAANADGIWNDEGARLMITVVPPFWRTSWFISLCALMVVGGAVFVYEYRLSRLRRAHTAQSEFSRQLIESQERERKRIASEVHDRLGQNLLVIKNRALLGLQATTSDDRAREQFDEISGAVTEVIEEVREISYDLRPFHLDRLGLTSAIEV